MNRRDLLKGFVAATASVAIGLRMASKLPTVDLPGAIDTWRWELASDNYYYGIDKAKPWHVEIYRKLFGDEWELMEAQDLMAMAEDSIQVIETEVQIGPHPNDKDRTFVCGKDERWPWNNTKHVTHEIVEEYGVDPNSEEMEAAAVIAMSQGMAAYQCQGHGSVERSSALSVSEDLDVIWVPRIYETEKALFKYG